MKQFKVFLFATAAAACGIAAAAVESGAGVRKTELGDGQVIEDGGDDLELSLASSAAGGTLVVTSLGSPVVKPGGGTLTVVPSVTNLLNRAVYWVDATVEESIAEVRHLDTDEQLDYTVLYGDRKNNTYRSVYAWYDRRGRYASPFYLRKTDRNNIDGSKKVVCTNPYHVTNGWDRGAYVSFDTRKSATTFQACRAGFYEEVTKTGGALTNIVPKMVIMVYGSQAGGGGALLGASDGSFSRTGKTVDDPVLPETASDCDLYLDGVKADTATAKFNGGWQVLSLDPKDRSFVGMGCTNGTVNEAVGGQNIAEMLVYDIELTDGERVAVERYLAAKWGLDYAGTETGVFDVTVRAEGSGTLKVGGESGFGVTLGGIFEGTLDLNGHTVELNARTAPTREEVAAISGRCGWFDPSMRESLTLDDGRQNMPSVIVMEDVGSGSDVSGYCLWGTISTARAAVLNDGWLDFRKHISYGIVPDGAVMRMKHWPLPEDTDDKDPDTMSVQTVMMVQNSMAGGGTPFLATSLNPGSSALKARVTGSDGMTENTFSDPIWAADTPGPWKNKMTVYLNGIATDGETRGFTGAAEVFTTLFDDELPLSCFGNLYGNVFTNSLGEMQGEIIGEILCYSRKLTDSERRLAEAYLLYKWCGRAMPGYGDYSGATVTGAGTLRIPAGAKPPAFSDGFTGSAHFGATEFSFAIDTAESAEKAVDAVVAENGTFAFPDRVTVRVVNAGPRIACGSYVLVGGADIGDTQWTLDPDTGVSYRSLGLKVTDDAVYLEVREKGLVFIVK